MDTIVEMQADNLASKLKHYLITTMGRSLEEATIDEFYRAFIFTLREEVMINWASTQKTYAQNRVRRMYYLSMEYLPGRYTGNNMINLGAQPVIQLALKRLGKNLRDVFRCESDPGLGNGGLGRLASCYADSLATLHYPSLAYGLRYQYGIFEQELWDGLQIERPDRWLHWENPWDFRRDTRGFSVKFGGHTTTTKNSHGDEVQEVSDAEEVRALAFDTPIIGYKEGDDFTVNSMRLWTTKESPRNFELQRYNAGQLDQAAENMILTDVLYPNDNNETGKRMRLKQEFLLVSASLQDIVRRHMWENKEIRLLPDKVRIQINDTHPSLVVPELIRILTKNYEVAWGEAVEMTRTCVGFTNHTILRESMEQWDRNRMVALLPRQYAVIERLNLDFCETIRKKFPGDEERVRRMSIIQDGHVHMAYMAIVGTHRTNGVSALHSDILKTSTFKDFYELYPERFVNVTNGVTQRRWLMHCNPKLADYITKKIGSGWLTDFPQIRKLADFANDRQSQSEFLAIKRENKLRFCDFVKNEMVFHDYRGNTVQKQIEIDPDSLFDMHIKRIHEYKRQLMNALHCIMIYHELLDNPKCDRIKRTVVFGGKAAPGYARAKEIIRLIYCLARKINNDPAINGRLKILFVENYNVTRAELLIPAAELSQQISTASYEASGTGNMKLSINGALTIGTDDGAQVEMRKAVTDQWWPFCFGCSSQEIEALQHNRSYNAWEYYSQNPAIRRAVDALRDRSFTQFDAEHEALNLLYQSLVQSQDGGPADRFFVLKDLTAYYETQRKVEALYKDPYKWAEYAMHNVAGMGQFSSDVAIENYVKNIWQLERCLPSAEILAKVRDEYSEHDKCRIFVPSKK